MAEVRQLALLAEGFADADGLRWTFVGPLGALLVPETMGVDRWEALRAKVMAWQQTLVPQDGASQGS